ncbi:MAG: mandelate racemase [Planctomycetes bacterium]|nr:mandelate racemase [Planctomycetota bacterium]MCP4770878.1 mandelate racemase [Planctomycetota bacterium]MCP4862297.1 mandelate racemase [Planctomycetota bacterium]
MPSPLTIRIANAKLETLDCHTRLPFRFGIHTLTGAPYATATVEIEAADGRRAFGAASDLLVPKWFEKNPALTPEEDSAALVASAEAAFAAAMEIPPTTVFDLWWQLYRNRVAQQPRCDSDLLVRGFGVALLERAMLDAACRLLDCSFFDALKNNLFVFEPGVVHEELKDWDLAAELAEAPAASIQLRHTVGLLDALTNEELEPAMAPADGLPNSLEEDVQRYGLQWFKIKVAGRGQEDVDRLLAIAKVLKDNGIEEPRFTLDGNEQYADMQQLAGLLQSVNATPEGAAFLRGLAFIEQPLSRDHTFDPSRHQDFDAVKAFAPVIIDEADFGTWAFLDAIQLGYQGISIKACKGVFRALLNRGICSIRGGGLFQSGEDLTNLPVRALQQDLCLMTTLGIEHVERNGHHYFRGLDHLPAEEPSAALQAHPDLYHESAGTIVLAINNGRLETASLHCRGFGCRLNP